MAQKVSVLLLAVVILAGCNFNLLPDTTPTVELLVSPTVDAATASPSPTATFTPPPAVEQPQLATPEPSPSLGPPSETPVPTETPGPFVHVVEQGDTLGFIIQLYGYPFDLNVISEVVRLNPNVPNADTLPSIGSEILIPRPTATPVPQGFDLTATVNAQLGVEALGSVALPVDTTVTCHQVEEGDTIVRIAELYTTTLEILSQLNRSLGWFGCNFTQPSGGPNCIVNLQIGQCVSVPQPTPVPTATPTPSGNETATPTPTFAAPRIITPPDGAIAPAGIFRLQWVSVGVLRPGEAYLVEVRDTTSQQDWRAVTTDTSIMLPTSLIPSDGQAHTINWRVTVARADENGVYSIVGAPGTWRSFQWQSR